MRVGWEIDVRGTFEPIITNQMFDNVQRVLDGKRPRRQGPNRINSSFPLRQFARCTCGAGLTGSKSTGRKKKYAYYRCIRCSRVNIRAEVVGQQFTELMEGLKWRREYAATFNAVIRDTWTGREKQRIEKARALSNRIQELERKTAELLDLLIDKTISPKDFEEHRDRIQCARDAAEAELDDCGFPLDDFDGLIAFAERMRDRLPMLWNRSNVAQKMQIQPAIFPDGIEVTQKGIGTAKYSLFFNSLDVARNGKPDLVAQICPRWNRLQPWFELVSRTPHSRPAQRFTLSLTSLLSAVLGEPTFASWNWLDGRLRQVEGLRRAA